MNRFFISLMMAACAVGVRAEASSPTLIQATPGVQLQATDGLRMQANAAGKIPTVRSQSSLLSKSPKGTRRIADPKGEALKYSIDEYVSDGVYISTYRGGVARDIYFDGKDVYIPDIVSLTGDGSFVKGVITEGDSDNGVITFQNGDQSANDQRVWLATEDSDGYLVPDYEAESFSFNIKDGVLTPVTTGLTTPNMYLLAVDANDYIVSFCSIIRMQPVTWDTTGVQIPEGMEMTEYTVMQKDLGDNDYMQPYLANGCSTGTDYYFKGLFANALELPLKISESESGVYKVKSGSYIGLYDGCYTYVYAGKITTQQDEYGETMYIVSIDESIKEISFQLDNETKDLRSDNLIVMLQGEISMIGNINKPTLQLFTPGEYPEIPTGAATQKYIMRTLDPSSPEKDLYNYRECIVARDGNDIYFHNFSQLYPDLTFKGTYNDDGSEITVELPQYLGNKTGEHMYLYKGDYSTETSGDPQYDYVMFDYTTEPCSITMSVEDGIISTDDTLAPAPLFYNTGMGEIAPRFSIIPDLPEIIVPEDATEKSYVLSTLPSLGSEERQAKKVSVYNDGNDYYFQGLCFSSENAVVKGTLEDDGTTISVKLPQYCGINEFGYPVYAMRSYGRRVNVGYETDIFNNDFETGEITIRLSDGVFSCDEIIQVSVIEDNSLPVIFPIWKENTATAPELPEGLELETYIMSYRHNQGDMRPMPVKAAVVDNDFYLSIMLDDTECLMRGSIENGKVRFNTGICVNSDNLWYLNAGSAEGENHDITISITDTPYIEMIYDESADMLKCGTCMVFTDYEGSLVNYLINPEFIRYVETKTAPTTPIPVRWENWIAMIDQCALIVDIPWTNTDGKILNTDSMVYRAWIDGEIYEFNGSQYDDFGGENFSIIPYNYRSACFNYFDNSDEYDIWFYDIPQVSVAIQSGVYVDSEIIWSEITTLDILTGEISGVRENEYFDSEKTEPVSVEYYDLQGRKVSETAKGLLIRVSRYSDGTVKTTKSISGE